MATVIEKDSNVFPLDYGSYGADIPMVGFQACYIDQKSSVAELTVHNTNKWAWLPVPIEGLQAEYAHGWESNTVGVAGAGISQAIGKLTSPPEGMLPPSQRGQSTNTGTLDASTAGKALMQKGQEMMGVKGRGTRMLEHAYVSYSGPDYRTFSFNFALRPKSSDESDAIENIVHFFKSHSAPELMGGTMDLVRMYKVPHLFKIFFVPDAGLFKIKACACTSVTVKYGGEKYATFQTTDKPIQTDISLAFKEMTMLQASDYPNKKESH